MTGEVVRYDIYGNETPLPPLNNPNIYFGCSGYYNDVGNLVSKKIINYFLQLVRLRLLIIVTKNSLI